MKENVMTRNLYQAFQRNQIQLALVLQVLSCMRNTLRHIYRVPVGIRKDKIRKDRIKNTISRMT